MDISSCSSHTSGGSPHGYNLRKRSISNYFPPSSKRTRAGNAAAATAAANTATTAAVPVMSAATMPRSGTNTATTTTVAKTRNTRKHKKLNAKKWENFPMIIKDELMDFDDYAYRSRSHYVYKSSTIIDDLPVCMLSLVFKLLDPLERIKIERVCRRWRYVSRNFAWGSTRLLGPEHIANDEVNHMPIDGGWQVYGRRVASRVNSVVERAGKYIDTINLSHLNFLDHKICSVLRLTPRVVHLDLTAILLTNSSLLTIGGHLPGLKCVVFRRCFNRTQVERGMSRLLQACRQLEFLDISDNEHFYARECFEYLPPTLLHLYISHSIHIGNVGVAAVQRNCPQLRSLVMDRLDTIHPGVLNSLFERLTSLETLQFGECFNNFGNSDLLSIGKLKNLRRLTLYDNAYANETLLKVIGENCHNLEKLDLSTSTRRINDYGLMHISQLPKLKVLNLSGMRLLSDHTLREIAANGQLTDVFLHRCHRITDNSVTYLLKRNKQLRVLDVSYCELVTDVTMKQVVEGLSALHGKTVPTSSAHEAKKFRFWGKHSGVTSPMPKHLTHPWMKLMNEVDYEYVLMGHLIHFSNLEHFHQFSVVLGL